MGRHRCHLVAIALVAAISAGSGYPALALQALSPPVSGPVVLAFGARYADGDRQRTHSGLDIEASAGDTVVAAAAGRVTFAGAVPADGGGRAYAVTVQTAEESRVTLSPLESITVAAGETLAAGDEVGTLAAAGDGSVASTHVHLSVRVGDTYVDPAPLLVSPTSAPDTGGSAASSAAEVPDVAASGGVGAGVDGSASGANPSGVRLGGASAGADSASGTRDISAVEGAAVAAGAPVPGHTASALSAIDAPQRAAIRARIGSAYCDAITSFRATRATAAVPFARRSAAKPGSGSPEVPVIPVSGTAAAALLLGMAAGLRRHARTEAARETT